MNKILRKIGKKVLLIPIAKRSLEKICQFYVAPRLLEIKQRLDLTEAFIKSRAEALKNEGQPDLGEAFSGGDSEALEELVQKVLKKNTMIVEIGSWKGFSTAILAKTIAGYHGCVFAVDHWMGDEGTWNYEIARAYDIYSIFKKNMILLGIWDIVHPLVMDSQTASRVFADGILDLVFIDADHRYQSVKRDILSWLPKLRNSGILCGHDCEGYYSKYSKEAKRMIDEHLGDGYIPALRCHHGVIKALHDCFQGKYSIMPNSTIWYYIK